VHPPSSCEDLGWELVVEPWDIVQGMVVAPPPRLVLHLWTTDGCAEQAWRGRACASTAVAAHHGAPWAKPQASRVAREVAINGS
jgi:hypothetical protein